MQKACRRWFSLIYLGKCTDVRENRTTKVFLRCQHQLASFLRVLTDLFCWFAWASSSGFGSLKLGTSEYTIQNLERY